MESNEGVRPMQGDTVYDIFYGTGKVVSVEEDAAFTVQYTKARVQRYSTGGYLGQHRRVYWRNPIIVEPLKNTSQWLSFVEVVASLYKFYVSVAGKK